MEKSSFFDAVEVNGQYDRVYNASDLTDYLKGLFTSGVLMKQDENLQLVANGDMTVTLKPGIAYIDGKRYSNETDKVFTIADADGTLNRVDRLSVTLDSSGRIIEAVCRQGASSYNPVAPLCRRNADYTDYVIADIYVGAGVISISQADITDQRLNDELCGIVAPFTEVDVTNVYNQFQAALTDFINGEETIFAEWSAAQRQAFYIWTQDQENGFSTWQGNRQQAFDSWFATLQDILDENTAGHLQNEIEALDKELKGFKAADTALNYTNGKLTNVVETADTGKVKTTDLTYTNGKLTYVYETLSDTDGATIIYRKETILTYQNGKLTNVEEREVL